MMDKKQGNEPKAGPQGDSKKIALTTIVPGDAYAVLVVGGTCDETFPSEKRPWPDVGQQASFLSNLGAVYRTMVSAMGKDRIIVIAMLGHTISWLEECVKLGHPPCEKGKLEECKKYYRITDSKSLEKVRTRWKGMLELVKTSCKEILDNGGAQYDGEYVNPETVLHVLSGELVAEGKPVVPKKGAKSTFFWINTHGWHHAIAVGEKKNEKGKVCPKELQPGSTVCDVCRKPHLTKEQSHDHSSLKTREWFVAMPHRTPNKSLYTHVSTAGRNMDLRSPKCKPSPLSSIYWQQMFQVIHKMQSNDPGRVFVALYQFCSSGGFLKWMNYPAMRAIYKAHNWPIFMMSSSRENQYSLGFSFTKLFLTHLSNALISKDGLSLQRIYDASTKEYWNTHILEKLHNSRASDSLKYGEIDYACGTTVGKVDVKEIFLNQQAKKISENQSQGGKDEL